MCEVDVIANSLVLYLPFCSTLNKNFFSLLLSLRVLSCCFDVFVVIANILTFLTGIAHMKHSTNLQLLQNMLYPPRYLRARKSDFAW